MNKNDQYLELCEQVRCRIAPSPIHGVGVFALRDIKQGERLYVRWTKDLPARWYTLSFTDLNKFDRSYPEVKGLILEHYPCIINGCQFLSPNYDAKMICFVNHAPTPEQINYDERTDTALRNIKKGEEITENYLNMPNWENVFPFLQK